MERKYVTAPIYRIFDYDKAIEFYIDWLGFKIDWESRHEENAPIYMQVSKDNIILHLSEHHGDATPGSKTHIETQDVERLHKELIEKKYRHNKPGLEKSAWNSLWFEVIDPFGNKLVFNQQLAG